VESLRQVLLGVQQYLRYRYQSLQSNIRDKKKKMPVYTLYEVALTLNTHKTIYLLHAVLDNAFIANEFEV